LKTKAAKVKGRQKQRQKHSALLERLSLGRNRSRGVGGAAAGLPDAGMDVEMGDRRG